MIIDSLNKLKSFFQDAQDCRLWRYKKYRGIKCGEPYNLKKETNNEQLDV